MQNDAQTTVAPPPWHLHGRGYIVLMHFRQAFAARCAEKLPGLAGNACGGVGAVMVVDYDGSGVGPYRELLLVPGRFRIGGRKRYAVTDIVVSSRNSVVNGRANWGLPKELAQFRLRTVEDGSEHVDVTGDRGSLAQLAFRSRRLPFPATTAFALPAWHSLVQPWRGRLYRTVVHASGWLRPARLEHAVVDDALFPDFTGQRQLLCLRVTRFRMTFPPAATVPAAAESNAA